MVYVKNNLKYSMTFDLEANGLTKKFEFDCRRIYRDTGNVATTGVTPISEEDYNALYEQNKVFKEHIDKALMSKVKESGATTMANKMDALEKENAILKAQLEQKTKAESSGVEDKDEDEAEGSMKEQLEAMSKDKKKGKGKKPTAPEETEVYEEETEVDEEETEVDEKESF